MNKNRTPLFREAALKATHVNWLGEILLVSPLSLTFMTSSAVIGCILIVCFLVFGNYSKRINVSGQLAPDTGVLRVFTPQKGTVTAKHIHEGQVVKRGELLYMVSSESRGADGDAQGAISRQVELRRKSLREEKIHTQDLQNDEAVALKKRIDALEAEHTNLITQLSGQHARVDLADAVVQRASKLFSQGYYSAEITQQKQADLLDQRNRLATLERENIVAMREISNQKSELAILPLRQRNQIAQIDRILTTTDQEFVESEAKRSVAIYAPQGGVATALTADVGQTVDGTKALVSIIPRDANLQAHLYAPSRAIGFVRPSNRVLIRYQAFPYQKFGHAKGIVVSISRIGLSSSEIAGFGMTPSSTAEPLYRITVVLEHQSVVAFGQTQPLQSGMIVDADIIQEERKLYEWALEPLYSLTGKF